MEENKLISKDPLGDLIKSWEKSTEYVLDSKLPVVIRLDGRAFHTFTKNFHHPFDAILHRAFVDTTKALMQESGACYGYTQSDEITLVLHPNVENDSQLIFGGRVQKLVSCLASFASVTFNSLLEKSGCAIFNGKKYATFDCRAFNAPSIENACKAVEWREQDASKNSVQAYARSFFSSNQLHGKNDYEQRNMIVASGNSSWESLSDNQKYGTAIQRRLVKKPFTTEELESLPEKHQARFATAGSTFERNELHVLKIASVRYFKNPVDVVFNGEEPILSTNSSLP